MRLPASSVLILAALGFAGCASGAPDGPPPAPLHLVVMESPNWDFQWEKGGALNDSGLAECLGRELARRGPRYEVIPTPTYTRTAFPSLPEALVPKTAEYVRIALTDAGVQERVRSLGVDYLVYIAGSTEVAHDWGSITCGGGYGGGGCFGAVGFDKTSAVSAIVIDVDSTGEMARVSARTAGDSWLAVIGILPVWHNAPTERAACRALAEKLDEILR